METGGHPKRSKDVNGMKDLAYAKLILNQAQNTI